MLGVCLTAQYHLLVNRRKALPVRKNIIDHYLHGENGWSSVGKDLCEQEGGEYHNESLVEGSLYL